MTEIQLKEFQHGVDIGRGGVWLELTEEHYRKFRLRSLVEEVVAVTIASASGHPPFHAVDLIDL
jgi:hypothetical protein